MKVLFLCRLFYPHIGGVEKHVLEVSRELIRQGVEVTVITEELPKRDKAVSRPSTSTQAVLDELRVFHIPVGKEDRWKKFRIWSWMWQNRRLIEEADVVHCHDVFFWYLPFRFLYPRKPVYTTFHGYESYPIKHKAIRIRKLSEKLSKGNICIGDFIPKWYKTKANIVSYGATDIPKTNPDLRKKHSAIFIGRLDEQTSVMTYVEAMKKLKKDFPDFAFRIIGDGPLRKEVETSFPVDGFLENPERFISEYHYVFVSRYLSILEAFARKRLVFSVYDNPVKKDYLLLAPFKNDMVSVDSVDELYKQMRYFLDNPEKEKKLIDTAFAWVKDQTWEKLVNQYVSLWKKH